jgi:hypothetical protein
MKKQLASVTLVTFLAQLATSGKVGLVARYFGLGAVLDGYKRAFVLPNLITGMVFGAIQTGLFPVRTAGVARSDLITGSPLPGSTLAKVSR